MKEAIKEADLAIIDGSPGIGCPVIASITGVDMVLIVAEPSVSGISDMERIIDTAAKFGTKTAICINKYDTNLSKSEIIEAYCEDHDLPFMGRIPFDSEAVRVINDGLQLSTDIVIREAVKKIYCKLWNCSLPRVNISHNHNLFFG